MNAISRFNIAAVIFDARGRVLLCKRSMRKKIAPGKWRFPGGKVEEGETQVEALKREVREELSLEVVSFVETTIVHTYKIGGETHQTRFAHVVAKGSIKLNHENDEWAYVPLDEMNKYIEPHRLPLNKEAAEWSR